MTSKRTALLLVAAVAFVISAAGAARAGEDGEARVTGVEVKSHAADAAELVVHADGPLEFTVFQLSNPTRIVLDLPGADISGVDVPALSGDGLVANVTTTQFSGETGRVARVVAVLRGEVTFDAKSAGHRVVLAVRKRAAEEAQPAAVEADTTPVVEISGGDVSERPARRLVEIEARESSGGGIINLRTDGVVARYEIEEVASPSRLVIDLYDVKAPRGLDRALDIPGVARVRVGRHHEKTRVVIDGDGQLPHYDVAATGEGLSVLFSAPGRALPVGEGGTFTDMAFEKKEGFYRLRLNVGGVVAVRTVKDSPLHKVISLDDVEAKDELLGRHDFGVGPVAAVELSRAEGRRGLEVSLQLTDEVEQSVWQKDGSVFWDVRRASAAPAVAETGQPQPRAAPFTASLATAAQEGTAARRFQGKRITIDLMDADILNVLRLLGDVSGKNVVVGDDVEGKVTLKLKNVPWDQALDVVLKTKGLDKEVRGGIIRVAPKDKLDAERKARLELEEQRRKQIPTTVRLIPVNYAVAKELVPQIKELLSERGRVTHDERTNVIIVEDIRDNLEQAEKLVRTLDTQTPQVLIEARMVEATTEFSRSLGIQWGGGLLFSERTGNPTGLVFPNNVGIVGGADDPNTLGGTPTPGVFFPPNFAVNLPASNINSSIGLNLGSIGNYGFLNARLTAAEASGQAKTISAPKVTTLNNKTARIFQGEDILFPIVTDNQVNTQTIQARLDLEVTPHVTADGSVLMRVVMNNDTPTTTAAAGLPGVATKGAETELLVRDGDTAVIGGIYTRQFEEDYQETPFLGKIPLLGWLFKNYTANDRRNEMLVFLTPRIINRRSSQPNVLP